MKRLMSFVAIMIVAVMFVQTVNAQNTGTANFNLSMTVDEYIETTPAPIDFNFGTTFHNTLWSVGHEDLFYGSWGEWDLAYANCRFSVTLAGDNPAGQGVPRFAREEVGAHAGGGFDVLNTVYQIGFLTNGVVETDAFGYVWGLGASSFPKTANFTEAPHNGQVKMRMTAHVNSTYHPSKDAGIPLRNTVINAGLTNDQSADAGVYNCTMLVTLTAL